MGIVLYVSRGLKPKLARLNALGVLHHIIIQGIERRQIFKNDQDRDNLIDRLSILLPETQTACYACVFMPNHAPFSSRGSMAVLAVLFAACYQGL